MRQARRAPALLLPAEGEEWLLGLLALLVLLGAARHRVEPYLEPPPPPPPAHIDPVAFGRLDLNRATAGELESLPRIGPRLAERILAHRRTHGPFRTVEEIVQVRGIGPTALRRLTPLVVVGSPGDSTVPAASKRPDSILMPQGGPTTAER